MDDAVEPSGAGVRLAAMMRGYGAILRRHRVILFVTLALCMLGGLLVILLSTPDYRATASVEVQDVPAGAAGAATPVRQSDGDVETLLQTELEVLRSRALAEVVARDLALVGSPTFFDGMDVARPREGRGDLSQRQVEQEKVIDLLRRHLEVDLPGKSRVIRISFVSADPVLSARVANAYADGLIRSDLKRGFESGVQARRFLLGELDGARRDLVRAERDLAAYVARSGDNGDADGATGTRTGTDRATSIVAPSSQSVESRLAQLNALRTQAMADRIAAQKSWDSARRASADTLPEVIGNGAMQALIAERARARAALVEQRQFRKDDHPEMREARARLAVLDDQADQMAGRIRTSLRERYDIAADGEKRIAAEIARLEGEAQLARGRDVQLGSYERSVDTYRMLHDSLLQRYRDMASQAGFQAGRIQPLDRAAVPEQPFSPRIGQTLAFAALGGLLLGLLLVAARHVLDDAVTSADTLSERVGLPLLGAVPVTGDGPQPPEIFTPMARSLLLASADGLPRSLLVTSAQAGEGKSLTLHALALALGGLGKRILVIDGDMRRPVQHRLFGVTVDRGISEVLTGQARVEDVILPTATANVVLLPCGALPPNPTELLATPAFDRLMDAVRDRYDSILIDAPPILGLDDTMLLVGRARAGIMVIEWGRNHHGGLRASADRLRRSGAVLIGAILTKQQGRTVDYDYHRRG